MWPRYAALCELVDVWLGVLMAELEAEPADFAAPHRRSSGGGGGSEGGGSEVALVRGTALDATLVSTCFFC